MVLDASIQQNSTPLIKGSSNWFLYYSCKTLLKEKDHYRWGWCPDNYLAASPYCHVWNFFLLSGKRIFITFHACSPWWNCCLCVCTAYTNILSHQHFTRHAWEGCNATTEKSCCSQSSEEDDKILISLKFKTQRWCYDILNSCYYINNN